MVHIHIQEYPTLNLVEVLCNDDDLFALQDNELRASDSETTTYLDLPDWLADGIRELVKNKIEQENNEEEYIVWVD